jgi:GNAT superfamily N-acetyltransferase
MRLTIRPGKSTDAFELSNLALKAKAYWPYDEKFISDCANDLQLSPERAGGGLIFVGEEGGAIVGFYGFGTDVTSPEMTHLFVDPKKIGKGFGKLLWNDAKVFARSRGWKAFQILADPYAAEKFYLPMGCQRIGEVASSVRPDRKLPLLRFDCAE